MKKRMRKRRMSRNRRKVKRRIRIVKRS